MTPLIEFLVVDLALTYNVILGMPTLNMLRAIPSIYHRKIKFETPKGVGDVLRDQIMVRQCYSLQVKGYKPVKHALNRDQDPQDVAARPAPVDYL